MRLPWVWNARPDEVAAAYPCGAHVPAPSRRMVRAVDVAAGAPAVWPWLGQLRVAPYSYDLVDNLGRRSPRRLLGLAPPVPGERFLLIFRITGVVDGVEITAAGGNRVTGPYACTYRVLPDGPGRSRLVARLDMAADTRLRRLLATATAWGDLVMMRRQLRTLAGLAAGSGRA
ncbi:polyketide cyclase [Pseudonocardia spirodelae]|uniref:Polyketide cyclase n=1 Tax=Pseudonocardia spirodelae TaxID=3133431 RepID=A0ABU8T6N8_9PSEU